MTEYLSSGVYVEEFEMGARPIEGVTTETDDSNEGLYTMERNNYFYGNLMEVRDFQDEEEYFNNKRSLPRVICGRVVVSSSGKPNQTFKIPVPAGALVKVWVNDEGWKERDDLVSSGPYDAHFMVDYDSRDVRFGDGVRGRIPPQGKYNIQLFYCYGRKKCREILSLIESSLPSIAKVTKLIPATGGVASENPDAVRTAPPPFFRMIQKKKIEDLDLSKLQIKRLQQIIADLKDSIGLQPQDKNKFITLFEGADIAGKTIASEALAMELRCNLYRVDLSNEVSKYIGETEKNLRRIFESAEDGGAILFFDEADALFGKRSEVKDSHDRYANIKISYLLQRIEKYSGLVILSSKNVINPQYLPKFRYIIKFPLKSRKKKLHY